MRSFGMAVSAVALCAVAVVALTPEPAQAHRCTIFKASHNGTDMFNPDGGAKGTRDVAAEEGLQEGADW